jgi:hypothetical protein
MKLEGTSKPTTAAEAPLAATQEQLGLDVDSLIRSFNFHLTCTLAKDQYSATNQDRYQALALAVRDRLVGRWIQTQQQYHIQNVKRICYLSLEFLIGRAMGNNVINLLLEDTCRQAMQRLGLDWDILRDVEVDAALGNGGLGRLAACFVDSMATLRIPAIGYGIRYDYGIFRQQIPGGPTAPPTGTGSARDRSSARPTTRRSSATARPTSTTSACGRQGPPTTSISRTSAAAPMWKRWKTRSWRRT